MTIEVSWFSALCDDDYEFLGHPDEQLLSSWGHCRNIVLAADRHGYDNVLLPSGYELGIDNATFAAAVAPLAQHIRLLLAVRCGELIVPQLARQLATIDQILEGRLTVNIISSDLPGETLDSEPRYRRSTEIMFLLRELLNRRPVDFSGEFLRLTIDPPRLGTVSVERHLWTGVGRARSGAGAAIVGDPDQVLGKIRELEAAGVAAFILSGYPHLAECDLFARYVLPALDRGRLEFEPDPVVI